MGMVDPLGVHNGVRDWRMRRVPVVSSLGENFLFRKQGFLDFSLGVFDFAGLGGLLGDVRLNKEVKVRDILGEHVQTP